MSIPCAPGGQPVQSPLWGPIFILLMIKGKRKRGKVPLKTRCVLIRHDPPHTHTHITGRNHEPKAESLRVFLFFYFFVIFNWGWLDARQVHMTLSASWRVRLKSAGFMVQRDRMRLGGILYSEGAQRSADRGERRCWRSKKQRVGRRGITQQAAAFAPLGPHRIRAGR